jgi:adenylate cyclase
MERRLAAILAADVVGYSRLIRADEEGTLAALKLVLLVEFASVVEAVRAAAEMQQALAECNATQPQDRRIEFRVGVNLGE